MRIFTYQDGLQVFGFNFPDKREDLLSSDHFKYLQFGYSEEWSNLWQIFEWGISRITDYKKGEIFSWDPTKIYTT